jgi:hypothetical protein
MSYIYKSVSRSAGDNFTRRRIKTLENISGTTLVAGTNFWTSAGFGTVYSVGGASIGANESLSFTTSLLHSIGQINFDTTTFLTYLNDTAVNLSYISLDSKIMNVSPINDFKSFKFYPTGTGNYYSFATSGNRLVHNGYSTEVGFFDSQNGMFVIYTELTKDSVAINWESYYDFDTLHIPTKILSGEYTRTTNDTFMQHTSVGAGTFTAANFPGFSAWVDYPTAPGPYETYITTIGLFNDANELLAVAKLKQPLSLSGNVNWEFLVNIDLHYPLSNFS